MKKKLLFKTLLIGFSLFAMNSYSQSCLKFDGINDYINTNFEGITGNNPITVEAWVKTGGANNEQVIAAWGSDAYAGGRFTFRLNAVSTNDVVRIENKGGGINGTINVNDGNWHHVAVTYSPTASQKYALYVDGNLDTQGNISQSLNVATGSNMLIGRRINPALSGYFDGSMDDVRVWNVTRTQAEIAANKDLEFCGTQTGLVAYFKFNNADAGSNNTTYDNTPDTSGNNLVGILTNFALTGTTSNYIEGKELTLSTLDTSVTTTATTLTANESGIFYQWIDCNNGNEDIVGETGQTFTPTIDGSYAVVVTKNGCITKSECINFSTLSTNQNEFANQVKLFPNPTTNNTTIKLTEVYQNIDLSVQTLTGQIVFSKNYQNTNEISLTLDGASGMYFVSLKTDSGATAVLKVLKQ